MGKYDEYIKAEALSLGVGDSRLSHCPFCDNCVPYSPSMSVTRVESGLLHNCFRAVCGAKGFVGSLPQEGVASPYKIACGFVPRPFREPTRELTNAELDFLKQKYDLSHEQILYNGILWVKDRLAIAMPLFTRDGTRYGYNIKDFKRKKKSDKPCKLSTRKVLSRCEGK